MSPLVIRCANCHQPLDLEHDRYRYYDATRTDRGHYVHDACPRWATSWPWAPLVFVCLLVGAWLFCWWKGL